MIPANTLWVLVLAIVVLYLVAPWARARTTTDQEQSDQVRYLIRSGSAGAADSLGARSSLVVSRYYFRHADADSAPADPSDFYDELFIDLRETDSAQTWQNSIHVATPRGLDRMMIEEHWDSVIGGELLIVRKYDLDTILKAAIEHLQEIYEVQVKLMGRGAPESPERM